MGTVVLNLRTWCSTSGVLRINLKVHAELTVEESEFFREGWVIRTVYTMPENMQFTGSNPPYFTKEAITFLSSLNRTVHLVVDLPSVDREQSEELVVHGCFFGLLQDCKLPEGALPNRLITEFAAGCNPTMCCDGLYLLSLQSANFDNVDAVPSRPVLYPLLNN